MEDVFDSKRRTHGEVEDVVNIQEDDITDHEVPFVLNLP